MYATHKRQTDVRRASSLNARYLGAGRNNSSQERLCGDIRGNVAPEYCLAVWLAALFTHKNVGGDAQLI